MKKLAFCFFLCLISTASLAQDNSITVKDVGSDSIYKVSLQDLITVEVKKEKSTPKTDPISWDVRNNLGFHVSEVAFVNWNSGGTNSISGLWSAEFVRNFKKDLFVWNNRFATKFGISSQAEVGLRKTSDEIDFSSTFGYRRGTVSNWYSSGNFSFKTQFGHGYAYSGDDKRTISTFMAPAYLMIGVGTIYSHDVEKFTAYFSPLTLKSTFVLHQELANSGAFGVDPAEYDAEGNLVKEGKTTRMELGVLLKSSFEKEIYKNIHLQNRVSFYSDYVNNFGNFDIDWEVSLNFKVNEFVNATFGSHVKYDNDIKYNEIIDGVEVQVSGAKIQWKQLLGIGLIYSF